MQETTEHSLLEAVMNDDSIGAMMIVSNMMPTEKTRMIEWCDKIMNMCHNSNADDDEAWENI